MARWESESLRPGPRTVSERRCASGHLWEDHVAGDAILQVREKSFLCEVRRLNTHLIPVGPRHISCRSPGGGQAPDGQYEMDRKGDES